MASIIDIVPSMPRIAACQQHRENAGSDTSFNYYRKNMCLPFLDHLTNGIDVCFDKYGKTVLMMQALFPSAIAERDVTIDDIVEIYEDDLPAPNNCQEEFIQCKRRWSARDISKRPHTIAQALKQYDSDAYKNFPILLKIAGTCAITFCEYERSGSVLKRLNAYLCASMRQ